MEYLPKVKRPFAGKVADMLGSGKPACQWDEVPPDRDSGDRMVIL